MTDQAALLALIEPVVADMGLALVRVQLKGGKGSATLQIMAEDPATGQLGIGVCAKLSRRLSDIFDEVDPIEEEYALEVSSPGIDRPLTRPHDWDDWKTHDVRVKLTAPLDGRKHIAGVIKGLDGDAAIVTVPGAGDIRVPLAAMSGAKLVLTNRLINATRPLDMSDADDILEDDEPLEGSANDHDPDSDED
ncbi:ribosome maturation factor [Glacieibacterium sp.]|uniref:ribosome maturation factor n=1 Tax=Glacieibacterium sp. TaxID=2860237 RepID=UPI003B00F054